MAAIRALVLTLVVAHAAGLVLEAIDATAESKNTINATAGAESAKPHHPAKPHPAPTAAPVLTANASAAPAAAKEAAQPPAEAKDAKPAAPAKKAAQPPAEAKATPAPVSEAARPSAEAKGAKPASPAVPVLTASAPAAPAAAKEAARPPAAAKDAKSATPAKKAAQPPAEAKATPAPVSEAAPPAPEAATEAAQPPAEAKATPAPVSEAAPPAPEAATEAAQPPAAAKEPAAPAAFPVLLCNAFPLSAPVTVQGAAGAVMESPLPYKSCRESQVTMKNGDVLDFMAGEAKIGKFHVRSLPAAPEEGQVLLLAVSPSPRDSTAAAFMTHVYKKEDQAAGPQLAVVDAFPVGKGSLRLAAAGSNSPEILRFNTVVPVAAGSYTMDFKRDAVQQTLHMDLSNNTLYVLMRVGNGSGEYPEKLVYFPNANADKDGSVHAAVSSLVLFLLAAVHWA